MTITNDNLGDTYVLKPGNVDKEKLSTNRNDETFIVKAVNKNQNTIYILNTLFLVTIAFIAGYNFKAWQVKNFVNTSIQSAEQYILSARENYAESEKILADLKKQEVTHFEGAVVKRKSAFSKEIVGRQKIENEKPAGKEVITAHASPVEQVKKTIVNEVKTIKKPVYKAPEIVIPSVKIYHTISEGESLSMFVKKAEMPDFLNSNPHITHPDIIYPGQKVVLKIPKQSIFTGSYMNNYFIRPVVEPNGRKTYSLFKWIHIPESETLLSHLIKQSRQSVGRSEVAYINLTDFTNTMKEEILKDNAYILTRADKINKVKKIQTGIYFNTIKYHPVFQENKYKGLHLSTGLDYYGNLDAIKEYLIRYLASYQSDKPGEVLFHFMIFDRTVVQVDYLENKYLGNETTKAPIAIGLVHITNQTQNTLISLERSLSTLKVQNYTIAEATSESLDKMND